MGLCARRVPSECAEDRRWRLEQAERGVPPSVIGSRAVSNKGEWEPFLDTAHLYTVPIRSTNVDFLFFFYLTNLLVAQNENINNDTAFVRF